MSDLLAQLVAENKAIRESKDAVLVVEKVVVPATAITKVEIQEDDGRKCPGYKLAKVAHADRMNQNHRIYPRREWETQVKTANEELIPAGKLIGAVDHASFFHGGNLKDSPILWKKLELKSDGAVEGEFTIIANHSRGADLQAQLDAGMAIGFSTVGYAKGREPTADERKLYGIAEDDEAATILEFYRLKKIDAVDDPSVIDAWTKEANQLAVTTDESLGGAIKQEEQVMKTLAELKEKAPELFALHEQAIQGAVAAKEADLAKQIDTVTSQAEADKKAMRGEMDAMKTKCDMMQSQCDQMKSQCDRLRKSLGECVQTWAKDFNVEVPYREVSEKDAAEKIEALTRAGEAKDAEIASLKAAAEKAQKEAADREAAAKEAQRVAEEAAAEAKRVADVKAKVTELLKSNRFADQIRKAVEKFTADKAFDVKAAETLIAEKTAEYEAVAAVRVDPDLGITGITTLNEEQTSTGSDAEALPIAAEMAKAL
ncbi:MAG: hypothetical protein ACM359_17190 [Bacillota bacterium]